MPRKTVKKVTPRKKSVQKNTPTSPRFLSPLFFLVIGCLFLALALFFQSQSLTKYSFASYEFEKVVASESATPTFISIGSIDLSLPIKPTRVIDGEWEIRDDAVSHLTASGNPGEKTNIIIYSHNTSKFFGKLPNVKKNDEIKIITMNGDQHTYIVTATHVVSPSDVWVIQSNNREELTLYTCFGFADLKRFVVKAMSTTTQEDIKISL